ncbi:MAG: MgtC/SapB family protein [Bacilli bacterium]|nr:MgtC/SapB family protein [Bacilli bacterium]
MKPVVTIDQQIAELFNNNFGIASSWNWGNLLLCAIAVILSVALCGVIGFEREKRGRSAGLRTHLLVGVGSCIVMIISIYGFPAMFSGGEGSVGSRDVARLAAQVITGVGFLGAGAIIHFNGGIKGLTTASTIWLVMAIGLCCGSMNFILAIGGTLIVMIVLISFRKIERRISKTKPMFVVVVPNNVPVMNVLLEIGKEYDCGVEDIATQLIKNGDASQIEVVFKLAVEPGKSINLDNITKELQDKARALSVQVINNHK